ncbi:hypothetical protein N826_08015 [Skermanella aerolata KACC 11604]|nr:hypothetical protein N826_08015 [Skermanella aerolata KACC 11604]
MSADHIGLAVVLVGHFFGDGRVNRFAAGPHPGNTRGALLVAGWLD